MFPVFDALNDAVAAMQARDTAVTIIFAIIISMISLAIYVGLRRRNYDCDSDINFDDLLTSFDAATGKVRLDVAKCLLMGGFAVDTIVLLYIVARAQAVPEGLATIYLIFTGAIVAPAVTAVIKTKVYLPMSKPPSESEEK